MIPIHSRRALPAARRRCLSAAIAATLALAALGIRPLEAADREEFTRQFARTLPLAPPQKLRLENSNGDVRVRTHGSAEVQIRASIRVSSSDREGAAKFADEIRVEVSHDAAGVSVRTVYPEKRWNFRGAGFVSYAVDYDVVMPETAPLDLENRFGNVRVDDLHAAADIRNANGKIDLHGGRGPRRIENSFGAVTIAGNDGDVLAVNSNGAVSATDVDGKLDVRNRFGRVDVSRIRKPATIANSNGDVAVRDLAGGSSVTTSFGRIDADTVGGDVELHDSNGAVTVRGVKGAARIDTRFGAVDASGIGGDASIEDSNGTVTVTDVGGSADVRGSFGAVRVERIGKSATVTASNAAVTVVRVRGDARIRTSFGLVDARDVGGNLAVDNGNGGIRANGIRGAAAVRTSFGPVNLDGVGDTIDAEDQNGSIDVDASDAKECRRTTLRTSFGAIKFVFPAHPDYRVQARTSFGRIHSDVPIPTTDRERESSESSMSGTIGSGRCPLTITNSNGSIDLVQKR